MIRIDAKLTPASLLRAIDRLFELSAQKIELIGRTWDPSAGTPVFTAKGRYTSRGWTEWTQGFQFGSAILQFDATDDAKILEAGRRDTVRHMATHVTHIGVHDHGFNNVSTYGNLLRLAREGRIAADEWEVGFYELALKLSGAIQAARWTELPDGLGFIHSFNGPHSLFVDTMRSLRSLAIGAPARPCADGRAGPPDFAAPATGAARRHHCPVQRVLRRGARRLRRARARGPRVGVQRQRRLVPLPEHPAGLLAVQHLDARTGVGADRLRGATRVPRHASGTPSWRPSAARKAVLGRYLAAARATADFYIEFTPT